MIISTDYILSNITIECENLGICSVYVYNYKGINYKVFKELIDLQEFISGSFEKFIYECNTEEELEQHLFTLGGAIKLDLI